MQVHQFESTVDAYDAVNVGDWDFDGVRLPVNDGDVLVVASEGVIGFACGAWPVAVVYPGWMPDANGSVDEYGMTDELNSASGAFHLMTPANDNPRHPANQYPQSIQRCIAVAEEDADVTGNEHWAPKS
jgi:hypothetical protein